MNKWEISMATLENQHIEGNGVAKAISSLSAEGKPIYTNEGRTWNVDENKRPKKWLGEEPGML